MRKLNSTIVYFLFVMVVMALICVRGAYGQVACSSTSPCVQLTVTNPNPIPSPTVLWSCVGSSTVCTPATLTAAQLNQTLTTLCPNPSSVWKCTEFSQSKTPQLYNDPEAWGVLVNYSSQGTSAGGVAATSPLFMFSMPNAPPQQTSIGSVPKVVTNGAVGPQ